MHRTATSCTFNSRVCDSMPAFTRYEDCSVSNESFSTYSVAYIEFHGLIPQFQSVCPNYLTLTIYCLCASRDFHVPHNPLPRCLTSLHCMNKTGASYCTWRPLSIRLFQSYIRWSLDPEPIYFLLVPYWKICHFDHVKVPQHFCEYQTHFQERHTPTKAISGTE